MLKVAVLREELFVLTQDTFKAIALNQLIYWSERMADVDQYIAEESLRMRQDGIDSNMKPSSGWIYKSAEELNDEAMLSASRQSTNRLLQALVDDGYLLWRYNPDHKWDRKKQYRVDFVRIQNDLMKLGYTLHGYAWLNLSDALPTQSDALLNLSDGKPKLSHRMSRNEPALPESTTETKTDISPRTHAKGQENPPNHQNGTSNQQVTALEPEEQSTALGQAVSGSHALALVPQAQAQVAVTAEVTPAPADSPQPERTPKEKAFGEITTLYIDSKFKPSANLFVQDALAQLVEEYGDIWVKGALQVALKYNKRSLGYVESVLDGWQEDGCAPWEKPHPVREARRDGSSLRQRNELASRGTVHVQPGKYDEMNERLARLRRLE